MPAFRYVVAFIVAGLIIAAAFIFAFRTQHAFIEQIRQDMREAEKAGTLPDELRGVDIDTWIPNDVGLVIPEGLLVRIAISDTIAGSWYIWIPVVCAICFGTAFAIGRFSN